MMTGILSVADNSGQLSVDNVGEDLLWFSKNVSLSQSQWEFSMLSYATCDTIYFLFLTYNVW